MAKNIVDQLPDQRGAKVIRNLRRLAEESKANQPPSFTVSGSFETAVITVANGSILKVTVTISPPNTEVVASLPPQFSIHKNTVSAANNYTDGTNWPDRSGFVVESFFDDETTNDKNQKFIIFFKNNSGSSIDVIVKGAVRYLVTGTTVAIASAVTTG